VPPRVEIPRGIPAGIPAGLPVRATNVRHPPPRLTRATLGHVAVICMPASVFTIADTRCVARWQVVELASPRLGDVVSLDRKRVGPARAAPPLSTAIDTHRDALWKSELRGEAR
jgi:hypothetical protein